LQSLTLVSILGMTNAECCGTLSQQANRHELPALATTVQASRFLFLLYIHATSAQILHDMHENLLPGSASCQAFPLQLNPSIFHLDRLPFFSSRGRSTLSNSVKSCLRQNEIFDHSPGSRQPGRWQSASRDKNLAGQRGKQGWPIFVDLRSAKTGGS